MHVRNRLGPTFPAQLKLAQPKPPEYSTLGPDLSPAYFVVVLASYPEQVHAPLLTRPSRRTTNVIKHASLGLSITNTMRLLHRVLGHC